VTMALVECLFDCNSVSGRTRRVAWMEPFDCAQDRLREIQESVFTPDSAALHLGYVLPVCTVLA
jgi:hypothetical protein